MKSKYLALSLIATLLLPMFAGLIVAQAATASTNPDKLGVDVTTRVLLSGSGYADDEYLWVKVSKARDWETADAVLVLSPESDVTIKTDDAGKIPAGKYIDIEADTLADAGLEADDKGYLLIADNEAGDGRVAVAFTVVDEWPEELALSDEEDTVGKKVTVTGEGFTADEDIEIWWDGDTKLATAKADELGALSVKVIIPEDKEGDHFIQALDTSTGVYAATADGETWVVFAVTPKLTVKELSISGEEGDKFTLEGKGFGGSDVIEKNTITAGGAATTHGEVKISSLGSFSVVVTLDADIDETGFVDVDVTYDDAEFTGEGILLVSNPKVFGDEVVEVAETGNVGDSIDFSIWNFPKATTVKLYLGGNSLGSVKTDDTGAFDGSFTVPETFGGDYTFVATSGGLRAAAAFTVEAEIKLYDAAGNAIEDDDYVNDGDTVRVLATGLAPRTKHTVTQNDENVVEDERVVSVLKGTLTDDDMIRSTYPQGTIEFTFSVEYDPDDTDTATELTVTVDEADLEAIFLAIGTPTLEVAPVTLSVSEATEITVTAGNLIENTKYQILFDGAVQDLTYDETEKNYIKGPEQADITFTVAKGKAVGVHDIALVYMGGKEADALESVEVLASKPDGDAEIELSKTTTVFGVDVKVYGWSFDDAEEDVAVNIAGTEVEVDVVVDDNGAFEELFVTIEGDDLELPMGEYLVWAESKDDPSKVLTIAPRFDKDDLDPDDKGAIGAAIDFTAAIHGLEPNTRYVLVWDVTGTPSIKARFVTDADGKWGDGDETFKVPNVPDGTYTLGIAREDTSTTYIDLYTDKAKKLAPVFTIETAEEFEVTGGSTTFIPLSQVKIAWDIDDDLLGADETGYLNAFVELDGYTVFSGAAYYDASKVYAAVTMPNGAEGDVVLRLTVDVDPDPDVIDLASVRTVVKRVSGAGAILLGTDVADDVASIKTTVGELQTSLSALDAKVVSLNSTAVTISTSIGTMSADLKTVNAKVVAIDGAVATVSTSLGTVRTAADTINARVVAIDGSVATVKTDLGTVKTDVAAVKTLIDAAKTEATAAKTEATAAKTAVAGVKTTVDATQAAVAGLSSIIWAAVILALIAAVAAGFSVVQISRKIAG